MKKIMFFLSLAIMLIVTISCNNRSEESIMINTQSVKEFCRDKVITVTHIDSIAGTNLNLVTVVTDQIGGRMINVVCQNTRKVSIGEQVHLLQVNYRHNLTQFGNFVIIK